MVKSTIFEVMGEWKACFVKKYYWHFELSSTDFNTNLNTSTPLSYFHTSCSVIRQCSLQIDAITLILKQQINSRFYRIFCYQKTLNSTQEILQRRQSTLLCIYLFWSILQWHWFSDSLTSWFDSKIMIECMTERVRQGVAVFCLF